MLWNQFKAMIAQKMSAHFLCNMWLFKAFLEPFHSTIELINSFYHTSKKIERSINGSNFHTIWSFAPITLGSSTTSNLLFFLMFLNWALNALKSIYSYNCTKNERSFFVQYLTLETFHEKKGKNQSNYIALESIIPSKFNSTPPLFTHSAIVLAECVRRNKKEKR